MAPSLRRLKPWLFFALAFLLSWAFWIPAALLSQGTSLFPLRLLYLVGGFGPSLAGVLSLLVLGLGQMVAGKGERGAAILIAVIIVGSLNVIWLSLYSTTSPGPVAYWTYTLPSILHDVFAVYGVVFWVWQMADAYRQAGQHATRVLVPIQGKKM